MGRYINQQFVFKRQNGKADFTRNVSEACVYCLKRRNPEELPMSLCGGCKRARYCVSAVPRNDPSSNYI